MQVMGGQGVWFVPHRFPVVACAMREGLGLAERYYPTSCKGCLWLPYIQGTLGEGAFQISPNGGPVQAPADRMWLKEGARKGPSSGHPIPFLCLSVSYAGPPTMGGEWGGR